MDSGQAADRLDQGDLAITTDVRGVLLELATKRMGARGKRVGARDVAQLSPGHVPHPSATGLFV